jgi:uncharacterized membrane protein YidH (DUF202 family)
MIIGLIFKTILLIALGLLFICEIIIVITDSRHLRIYRNTNPQESIHNTEIHLSEHIFLMVCVIIVFLVILVDVS